ncbi:piggyBac transposable element-derived protein 4-like [Onthophagus taurus]|uniref:piggyBac transposable element-derived protein 4-like n=1 Tax=Onthophagus taurus TaxID=166361 RepID=UPI0039BE9ABB
MSSEDDAGPLRPKRAKKIDTQSNNWCGLGDKEVRDILKVVDNLDDCYLSEDEPFIDSGSEYNPESSSDSESFESADSGDDYLENANDTTENNNENEEEAQPLHEINIQWTDNEFKPKKHAFISDQCGENPDFNLSSNSTELHYFSSIFTEDIVDIIVHETNRYGAENVNDWKDLHKSEFYVFLALNLLMPRNKKLSLHVYWSTDPLINSPIFGQCMSRDYILAIDI